MIDVKRVLYKGVYKIGEYIDKKNDCTDYESEQGRCFLVGGIEHGNYGDHAINVAEYDWFERRNISFIEIPETRITTFINNLRNNVHPDDEFYFHGGGNMGDVWPDQEVWRQNLIETFPDNKIVIFPQSVNYDQDSDLLRKTVSITKKAKNLTIFLRDKHSYDFVKEVFPETVSVKLVPDMVLSSTGMNRNIRNTDVCLLMRSDKELVRDKIKSNFIDFLKNNQTLNVDVSDTCTDYMPYITRKNRRSFLESKLRKIGNSKVVVTDRLHGMIFSLITSTPVIVFDNNTHKIRDLILTWLRDFQSIYFVQPGTTMDELTSELEKLMSNNFDKVYTDDEKFKRLLDDAI